MLYFNRITLDKNFFYDQKDVEIEYNKYINNLEVKMTKLQRKFFDFFIYKKTNETMKKYILDNDILDIEDIEDLTDTYELLHIILTHFGYYFRIHKVKVYTEIYYDSENKEIIMIYDYFKYSDIIKDSKAFFDFSNKNINIFNPLIEYNNLYFFEKDLQIKY